MRNHSSQRGPRSGQHTLKGRALWNSLRHTESTRRRVQRDVLSHLEYFCKLASILKSACMSCKGGLVHNQHKPTQHQHLDFKSQVTTSPKEILQANRSPAPPFLLNERTWKTGRVEGRQVPSQRKISSRNPKNFSQLVRALDTKRCTVVF